MPDLKIPNFLQEEGLGKTLKSVIPPSLKGEMKGWLTSLNKATVTLRRMPDFIIVGAQKAGTSSLFKYCRQHPQINTCWLKEVHFFDKNFHQGEDWYRSHFPISLGSPEDNVVGEATPYYLIHPHAPKRIHDLLPSVKLIVLLRDPVERAISHYYYEIKNGREHLPIDKALMAEEKRLKDEWAKMLQDDSYISPAHQNFSYKQRGVYLDQLEKYFTYFSDDQILLLDCQELFSTPQKALCDVFEFLGVEVDLSTVSDWKPKNVNHLTKDVPSDVYSYLENYFAPHNERLFTFLGRTFNWR